MTPCSRVPVAVGEETAKAGVHLAVGVATLRRRKGPFDLEGPWAVLYWQGPRQPKAAMPPGDP